MKKFVFALAVLAGALLVPATVSAQAAESRTFRLLSIDIGYAPVWSLNSSAANNLEFPYFFSFNVKVGDPLTVGFESLSSTSGGTDGLKLLNIKYDFLPMLRATLGFGSVTGTTFTGAPGGAVALGFEVIPFSRSIGQIGTEFKLTMRYVTNFNGAFENHGLIFGLAFGIGF